MTPVIALGNRDAGDDAAGPLVADALRAAGRDVFEPRDVLELAELLAAGGPVIVVDAAAAEGFAGPRRARSSHGLGLEEAVGLAAALGAHPALKVYAIVGHDFRPGSPLSASVSAAVERVTREILRCA